MIQKADKMQHWESQLERYSEIQTDHWQALRKDVSKHNVLCSLGCRSGVVLRKRHDQREEGFPSSINSVVTKDPGFEEKRGIKSHASGDQVLRLRTYDQSQQSSILRTLSSEVRINLRARLRVLLQEEKEADGGN